MAGARRLVLTHFSSRYSDLAPFAAEAQESFDDVVLAQDLDRIPVPTRRKSASAGVDLDGGLA
jgi:ribonuclease Z